MMRPFIVDLWLAKKHPILSNWSEITDTPEKEPEIIVGEQSIPVTAFWGTGVDSIIGKFEPYHGSHRSFLLWKMIKSHPEMYTFELGYTENLKTGKKELMEISVVSKGGFVS